MPEPGISQLLSPAPGGAQVFELARVISGQVGLGEIPVSHWRLVSQAAIQHGLGPLLWWLIERQRLTMLEREVFQALESSSKIAGFNFQILQESQSAIKLALAQIGIPTVWLKGIALAQTIYPQPHLRPMGDLDVLVPYAQRQAAVDLLLAQGYRLYPQDALEKRIHAPEHAPHHYSLLGGISNSLQLELHYRLLGDDRLLTLKEMDWFWQESETVGEGMAAFQLLKPEAHFLYLCAHAILQHGEADFHLQRYYDLHLLAGQPALNWDLIIARAGELGWTYALERALVLTRAYFATSIPEIVFVKMNRLRPPDEDSSRAQNLQGAGHRWEETLLQLADYSPGERLKQIFHLTFPPGGYMRARYAVPPGQALFPYYLMRWLDAGREIISALLRRLGNR